jgi:xylulokinase
MRPQRRWAEQDVETYWDAVRGAVLLVMEDAEGAEVAAVGICGQSPTLVLVDRDGQPLRPAMIWQDTRAWQEADSLRAHHTEAEWAELFGMALPVDASYPLARIAWLHTHEPDTLARTRAVLQPKDYIVHCLTDAFVTDIWSSKGILHQQTGAPVRAYRDLLGIAPTFAPRGLPPRAIAGVVTPAAATALALPAGIPVVAGWTDSHVAILASGALAADGQAFDIAGTSEIIGITATASGAIGGGVLRSPVWDPDVPGRVVVYGPTQTGADALRWAVESLLAIPDDPAHRYETAMTMAETIPPGAECLLFLPYLDGERTPLWDPHARGTFMGFNRSHTAAHAVRAVLEGVAFAVRHVLDVAEAQAGRHAPEVVLAGGGIRTTVWNQIKADVLGRPVVTTTDPDASVLGAAMLAGLGAGIFRDTQAATDAMVRRGTVFVPRDDFASLYDRGYVIFRDMYLALQPLFPRLAGNAAG